MNKAKWIVEAKYTTGKELEELYEEEGEDPKDFDIHNFSEVEISVVREDNEHGRESYGWADENKIVLFDAETTDVTKEDMRWYKKVAKVVCEALNKKGL